MLEKSQEYLRLALAAAAILIGLSVAYHYVVYIPEKDRAQKLAAESKAAAETKQLQTKQSAVEKTALERRTNYRICLSAAQANYDARWNSSCKVRSDAAEKNRTDCIGRGITEESCRSYYPSFPAEDCTLPTTTSKSYDEGLREEKERCLEEARTGVLAPL